MFASYTSVCLSLPARPRMTVTAASAKTVNPMSRVATAVMVGFTVAHVAVGALTMAASVVLAVEIFRHVRRPVVEMAHGGVTVTS